MRLGRIARRPLIRLRFNSRAAADFDYRQWRMIAGCRSISQQPIEKKCVCLIHDRDRGPAAKPLAERRRRQKKTLHRARKLEMARCKTNLIAQELWRVAAAHPALLCHVERSRDETSAEKSRGPRLRNDKRQSLISLSALTVVMSESMSLCRRESRQIDRDSAWR